MKSVFAPDSMKGSLTALEAVELLTAAAHRHFPDAECIPAPVADGGEGTVDALSAACGGEKRAAIVTGPMGNPVRAEYAVAGETAIVEIAQASGLPLVDPDKPDPLRATSYGTGELILDAMNHGAKRLLIGIGGSATNDGGMGMLSALDVRFMDRSGEILTGCGADLAKVDKIDLSNLSPAIMKMDIQVICDVTNPLLGSQGATAIYGPQMGGTKEMMPCLESGMANYAQRLEDALGRDFSAFPGAGAAGGLGAILGGVFGAKMRSGIDAVLDLINFDRMLEGCSLVVTGEGRIDRQSIAFGKAPAGVAKRCQARNIPVIALVGSIGEGAEDFNSLGQTSILSIADGPMDVQYSMQHAPRLYAAAADRMFAFLAMGENLNRRGMSES